MADNPERSLTHNRGEPRSSTTVETTNTEHPRPSDEFGLCPICEAAPTAHLYVAKSTYFACLTCDTCWLYQYGYAPDGPTDDQAEDLAILQACTAVEPTYNPETLAEMARKQDLEHREWERAQEKRRRAFSILFAGITDVERQAFVSWVAPEWKHDPEALIHFLCTGGTDHDPLPF